MPLLQRTIVCGLLAATLEAWQKKGISKVVGLDWDIEVTVYCYPVVCQKCNCEHYYDRAIKAENIGSRRVVTHLYVYANAVDLHFFRGPGRDGDYYTTRDLRLCYWLLLRAQATFTGLQGAIGSTCLDVHHGSYPSEDKAISLFERRHLQKALICYLIVLWHTLIRKVPLEKENCFYMASLQRLEDHLRTETEHATGLYPVALRKFGLTHKCADASRCCGQCIGSDGTPQLSRAVCEYGDCDETPRQSSLFCAEHTIEDPTGIKDVGRKVLVFPADVQDPVEAEVQRFVDKEATQKPIWIVATSDGSTYELTKLQLRRALGMYEVRQDASRLREQERHLQSPASPRTPNPVAQAGGVRRNADSYARDENNDAATFAEDHKGNEGGTVPDHVKRVEEFLQSEADESRLPVRCKCKDLQCPRKRKRTRCDYNCIYTLHLCVFSQLVAGLQ